MTIGHSRNPETAAGRDAPSGIRTLVLAVRGQDDWPDYTNGAYLKNTLRQVKQFRFIATVRRFDAPAVDSSHANHRASSPRRLSRGDGGRRPAGSLPCGACTASRSRFASAAHTPRPSSMVSVRRGSRGSCRARSGPGAERRSSGDSSRCRSARNSCVRWVVVGRSKSVRIGRSGTRPGSRTSRVPIRTRSS